MGTIILDHEGSAWLAVARCGTYEPLVVGGIVSGGKVADVEGSDGAGLEPGAQLLQRHRRSQNRLLLLLGESFLEGGHDEHFPSQAAGEQAEAALVSTILYTIGNTTHHKSILVRRRHQRWVSGCALTCRCRRTQPLSPAEGTKSTSSRNSSDGGGREASEGRGRLIAATARFLGMVMVMGAAT